jgi:ABC-type uncharacterized transport system substrate-binding protein
VKGAEKNMKRKITSLALGALLLALCGPAEAQQAAKVPRIGFLSAASPSSQSANVEAFRRGLRELGYVEGKNIVIEFRYAEGKPNQLRDFATELARAKVDVIVTAGSQATSPAKKATVVIPIVAVRESDPVGSGFVASLARPSGNITGLSEMAPELAGKRLELLKAIVPKLSRVAVLANSSRPGNEQELKETELAAGAFEVKLQYLDIKNPKDIETAFRAANKGRADAVLVLSNAILASHQAQVIESAKKSRVPASYPAVSWVEAGGLMSYGASINDLFRRAATYVDKILKGANPADLPVEQPTKFEFVINLKAAKQISLTIPPNVLARADRVIK